jgi:hypothetical protein
LGLGLTPNPIPKTYFFWVQTSGIDQSWMCIRNASSLILWTWFISKIFYKKKLLRSISSLNYK